MKLLITIELWRSANCAQLYRNLLFPMRADTCSRTAYRIVHLSHLALYRFLKVESCVVTAKSHILEKCTPQHMGSCNIIAFLVGASQIPEGGLSYPSEGPRAAHQPTLPALRHPWHCRHDLLCGRHSGVLFSGPLVSAQTPGGDQVSPLIQPCHPANTACRSRHGMLSTVRVLQADPPLRFVLMPRSC